MYPVSVNDDNSSDQIYPGTWDMDYTPGIPIFAVGNVPSVEVFGC